MLSDLSIIISICFMVCWELFSLHECEALLQIATPGGESFKFESWRLWNFLVENDCWHAVKDNGIWFHIAYFILKMSQATLTDEWVKCWRSSDYVGKCGAVMYWAIAYMLLWTTETGFLFYYWGSLRLASVLSEKHSGISNFHLDEHQRQTERATV